MKAQPRSEQRKPGHETYFACLTSNDTWRPHYRTTDHLCDGLWGGYLRGSEVPEFDDPAMSLGLDKRDLDEMLQENLRDLRNSHVANEWRTANQRERLAIFPVANETTQHIDPQLDSLLSDMESYFVESGMVDVISVERQQMMMRETNRQHSGGFDPTKVAALGRQMGTGFFVTGKVYPAEATAKLNAQLGVDDARQPVGTLKV